MPRYNERQLHLRDLVPRFEKEPSSTHVKNALGAIEHLKEDGNQFWPEGSSELSRWRRACVDLWDFVNRLNKKQDLPTVLREFIQEFEHSTGRIFQMLCSRPPAVDADSDVERISRWCDFVFRLSTYGIVSSWIDDKTEEKAISIRMTMNRTTGETTVKEEHRTTKTMQVPKRYCRSTKDI